jgi:hypothetical protein
MEFSEHTPYLYQWHILTCLSCIIVFNLYTLLCFDFLYGKMTLFILCFTQHRYNVGNDEYEHWNFAYSLLKSPQFSMGVKLSPSHYGKNIDCRCFRTGC